MGHYFTYFGGFRDNMKADQFSKCLACVRQTLCTLDSELLRAAETARPSTAASGAGIGAYSGT